MEKIKVAGYVKLAKLWEKRRDYAMAYHDKYFHDFLDGSDVFELTGVYVDITGNKEIYRRKEMVRLINDCIIGEVDCIMTMTKAYFAANMRDFLFLFLYLGRATEWRIDFITQDESDAEDTTGFFIDTIKNEDNQKEALREMIEGLVELFPKEYEEWKEKLDSALARYRKGGCTDE